MYRILISTLLIIHGLFHLFGFAKALSMGAQSKLAGKALVDLDPNSSKVVGIFWLATCLLFVVGAILYLIRKDWYWIPAAFALFISQTLIVIHWNDAKYGTFVNVLILFILIFAAAAMQFNLMVRKEVKSLVSNAHGQSTITKEDIKALPLPVRRWLISSGVIGKPADNVLHIRQRGQLRQSPTGKWLPFEAEQFFTTNPPAFVWKARIKALKFISIAGRDKYDHGKGNMLIKPLYLFVAANASGKEVDQGTLLRFLAEMAWFPQAATSPYLHWEPIDDHHAKVTMGYGGMRASGIYSFNSEGNVSGFEAQRFGDFNGVLKKETWSIAVTEYATFRGVKIGNVSEVTWKLKEGDFMWLKMEVTSVETYSN